MAKDKSDKKERRRSEIKPVEVTEDVEMENAEVVKVRMGFIRFAAERIDRLCYRLRRRESRKRRK